ncbi:MAG: MFS transporter [Deltaproteobacteria bacterium]|nr:MAG: MFS transporter [Deltaproteobacteria bacterium]
MKPPNKPLFHLDRNVWVAGLVSFFMDFSSEMVNPLLPLFLTSVLGVNKAIIGSIEGIAESTASFLKLYSGWLSDRIGKRKFFMGWGYGLATLSRPLLALAPNWNWVLASRFIDRFGKGVRTAPRDAIIAESTLPENLGRAFGLHRSLDTLGAIAGPGVAFLLLAMGANSYRLVFWVSIVPGLIAVLLIILFIREKRATTGTTTELPRLSWGMFDLRFKFFMAIIVIFTLGNSSDAFLILRAQQVGIAPLVIPLVYIIFNLVYAVSATPAGVLADRLGRHRMILLGFGLFSLIYSGLAGAQHPWQIWLLFGLYGLFMGLTEGVQKAYLATIIPESYKATAFGLYQASVGLALLPASIIAGLLWDHIGPAAPFIFGAATGLTAALLFIVMLYQRQEDRQDY